MNELGHATASALGGWHEVKQFVERATAISPDALHVIAGVVLQITLAVLLRRPLSSWRPWLVLLALLVANEALDFWFDAWPSPAMQFGESAKDLLLTMLVPTLLLALTRLRGGLFTGDERPPD